MSEKTRECGPCCHNGHGEKKSPVREGEDLKAVYRCWLESCGKKVAWYEGGLWHFDPCEHIKLRSSGDIVF